MPEPGAHALGVSLQGCCRGRHHVEGLTQCGAPVLHRFNKALRHIVRVDVVYGFHPEVRELDLLPLHQQRKDGAVEVGSGVDRGPARPYQVARVQDGHWELAWLAEKIGLNRSLFLAIVAERRPWRGFRGGYLDAWSVHPDCAAVKQVGDPSAQRFDELLRALKPIEGKLYDHLCIPLRNAFTKSC